MTPQLYVLKPKGRTGWVLVILENFHGFWFSTLYDPKRPLQHNPTMWSLRRLCRSSILWKHMKALCDFYIIYLHLNYTTLRLLALPTLGSYVNLITQ